MNHETIVRFFCWLALMVFAALCTLAAVAVLSQFVPAVHGAEILTAPSAPMPSPLSWLTPEVITGAFGLIASIIAVIQNRKKSTAEKIRDTLILGIEHGSVMAERSGNPDAVKYAIRARAVAAGLEAILAPRVQSLTEIVDQDESEKRVAIEAAIRAEAPAPDDSGADQP